MLKDIAKVLVGATLTEMGWNIWLLAENMTPVKFMGLEFGFGSIMAAVLVNFLICILLVYYSWFWKAKEKENNAVE
ncbi:MAG: hypothetical protein PHU42_01520 [Patescibacteria group bacterium]|nr:hypothetical protein [Patescibacteria group bacterium]